MPEQLFTALRVEPKYSTSRALGGGREPRQPFASGYAAVQFRCPKCRTEWRATPSSDERPGSFLPLQGNMSVTCP